MLRHSGKANNLHDRLGGQKKPHRTGTLDIVLKAEWNLSKPVIPKSPAEGFKKKYRFLNPIPRPESKALGRLLWNH